MFNATDQPALTKHPRFNKGIQIATISGDLGALIYVDKHPYTCTEPKEVRKLNKKLTANLPQGTLGKLHPPYQLLVKSKKNVRHIQTIIDILGDKLGVKLQVPPEIMDTAKAEDSPDTRIASLTKALLALATEAVIKNNLYKDIPKKELTAQLRVITSRWAEDVIEKIRTLPELRRKKLLSDRKCRLKNYITKCPVCGAPESSIQKDYQSLTAKCTKCGWTRTFDGSGKRTIPKKPKKEKKTKKTKTDKKQ